MAGAAAPTAHVDLSVNHNAEIIALITVFPSVALLTLISRFVSRHMKGQRYMLDDWLLVAAWILALTESILSGVGIKYGNFGYHVATMTPEKGVWSQKALFAGTLLQTTSMTLSILIVLHRIFNVEQGLKRTCWVLGTIVVLWWLGATFGFAFVCFPASRMWSPSKGGHCGKHTVMNLVVPIPWLLTDIAILIAPLTVIRRLEMLAARKKKVYAAFSLAL